MKLFKLVLFGSLLTTFTACELIEDVLPQSADEAGEEMMDDFAEEGDSLGCEEDSLDADNLVQFAPGDLTEPQGRKEE